MLSSDSTQAKTGPRHAQYFNVDGYSKTIESRREIVYHWIRGAELSVTNHSHRPLLIKERFVFLDSLRFVAAVSVLLQHALEQQGKFGAWIASLLSPGVFGVVLFFIVSGFVIPMSVKGNIKLKVFALKRFFRIYPLIIFTFVLIAFFAYATSVPGFDGVRSASVRDWLANILIVQDYTNAKPIWGVTWTLSLEFLWYGLFAFSFFFIGPRFDDLLSIIAPILMVALVMLSILVQHRLPLGRIGMIYASIFGCRAYRYFVGQISWNRLLVDAILFITIMAASNVVSFGVFKHPNITMNEALFPWICASVLFIFVTGISPIRESSLLNNRPMELLGSISYSIYLLHPVAIYVSAALIPGGFELVFIIFLTFFISVMGYFFIELPGQRLGKFLSNRLLVRIPSGNINKR